MATDNIFSKRTLQWLTTIVCSIDHVLPTWAMKCLKVCHKANTLEWGDDH